MRYTVLGASGLRVSRLALGGNGLGTRFDSYETKRLVHAALDAGVTVFDTADVYGGGASEEALGRALAGGRDKVVLATKGRWATGPGPNDRGSSRIHLRAAVEASLRRLGTDHIDLYQLHAPDPATPIEETVAALDQLVTAGKILYVGTSNYAAWQLVEAQWKASTYPQVKIVATQAPYSLLQREAERELLPAARACGVGFLACVPLARGLLAGAFDYHTDSQEMSPRRRAFLTPANLARMTVVEAMARELGMSTSQLAIQTVLGTPGVDVVIAGASSIGQVTANAVAAAGELDPADRDRILAGLCDAAP